MKRVLSLTLALIMLLSICSLAVAEDKEVITLRVVGHWNTRNHAEDRSDCTPEQLEWYEKVRNLLPGKQIEIEWVLIPENKWNEQLPLLLAANDVPDILNSEGSKWIEFFETGMFLDDLDALLAEYGKDILANCSPASLDFTKVGGKQVAIPAENVSYKYRTVVRADWIKKLGYEVKSTYTVSELAQIMTDVVEKDPDGNGVKDTIGLGAGFNNQMWSLTFMPIFGAFGGLTDQYYFNEDGLVYGFDYTDEFRNALIYLADLYAKGVIDPEAFVLSENQARMKAAQGKSFLHVGWWCATGDWCDAGLLELAPEAELMHIYVTSDDGTTTGMMDNGAIWKTALISASCEHPEAAIAFINFCNTVEGSNTWGYELDENGLYTYDDLETSKYADYIKQYGQSNPQHTLLQKYKYNNWFQIGFDAIEGEDKTTYSDEDYLYGLGRRNIPYDNMFSNMLLRKLDILNAPQPVDPGPDASNQAKRDYWNSIGSIMQSNPDNHNMYQSIFYGLALPQAVVQNAPGLETTRTDWVVAFVNGTKDIKDDAVWNEYLKAMDAKGAQESMEAYAEAYNAFNGTSVACVDIVE